MSDLIDISLSFPTVVFTTLSLISVGYWLLSASLGLAGDFGIDTDLDLDTDLEPDFDLDAEGGPGLGSLIETLGLHLVPISVSLTALSLASWLTSVVAVVAIGGADRRLESPLALATVIAAFIVGVVVAGRLARLVAPVFVTQRGERHRDLIGRMCTVQTGRVDTSFGQGVIRSLKGDEHVVQIRCAAENHLRAGDVALVVDVDDGVFVVSPDVDGLT